MSSYHAPTAPARPWARAVPGGFFAGVAPGARLVDCKVLSDAGASVGGSPRGVEWCIANRRTLWAGLAPGSKWQGIDVLSMSLGSTECAGGSGTSTGAGSQVINVAVDSGLVVVIATGNDNSTDCIASPAAADKSIAVGASAHYRSLDRSGDKVTSFSNEGVRDDDGDADHFDEYKPSVVAPGAGIISAAGRRVGRKLVPAALGTSMACPHVAGCVALLRSQSRADAAQVRSILQNTPNTTIATEKATGSRPGPLRDRRELRPECGWGLVDVYAASLEALNSTYGVQVVQDAPIARVPDGAIDFRWVTQREHPFLGFNVYRAPDVAGSPGAFTKLNTLLIPSTGDPNIQGDDNRQHYLYADTDAALVLGQQYWYRVEWVDLLAAGHLEPPVPVAFGTLARVARPITGSCTTRSTTTPVALSASDPEIRAGNLGGADLRGARTGEDFAGQAPWSSCGDGAGQHRHVHGRDDRALWSCRVQAGRRRGALPSANGAPSWFPGVWWTALREPDRTRCGVSRRS